MPQFNRDVSGISEAGGSAPLYGSDWLDMLGGLGIDTSGMFPGYARPGSDTRSGFERGWDDFMSTLANFWSNGGAYQPTASVVNPATSATTQAELISDTASTAGEYNRFVESGDPTLVKNPFGSNIFNQLSGATDQMKWSSWEAANARIHATDERIAAQQYNSAEAMAARDWTERMDSTAVQRRMQDLAAAGINPLYMFSGSGVGIGSTGGGSAASVSPGSSSAGSSGANGASAVNGIIKGLATLLTGLLKAVA